MPPSVPPPGALYTDIPAGQVPPHTCPQEEPGTYDVMRADGDPCARCTWMLERLAQLIPMMLTGVASMTSPGQEGRAGRDRFYAIISDVLQAGLRSTALWHLACYATALSGPVSAPRQPFAVLHQHVPDIFELLDELLRAADTRDHQAALAVFAKMRERSRSPQVTRIPTTEPGGLLYGDMTAFVVLTAMAQGALIKHTGPLDRLALAIMLIDSRNATCHPIETMYAARIGGAYAQGEDDQAHWLAEQAFRENLLPKIIVLLGEALARHQSPGGRDIVQLVVTEGEQQKIYDVDQIPAGESVEAFAHTVAMRYVGLIADGHPTPETAIRDAYLQDAPPDMLVPITHALANWWSQTINAAHAQMKSAWAAQEEAGQEETAQS